MSTTRLFTINWGDSGPGFSWLEKYYVTRVPGYEVCIVTGSADSPDAHGYCDFAIGWYAGRVSDVEKAGACIRAWWSRQAAQGQQRWAYLFDTGAVEEGTAERWADDVWPVHEDQDDDEDDLFAADDEESEEEGL